ncbi:MAG: HAD hydrolase-like protein [Firmicutes bacterium]|nr:HAD hydrolase-like protein [Bacillota bacterium]
MPCNQRPVLIWDVDGTLLAAQSTGRAAMNDAFWACYGIARAFDDLNFAGAHDHDLWAQAIRRHCNAPPAMSPARFFHAYLQHLQRRLNEAPIPALPGVREILCELTAAGYRLVLGTGNIRAGAYLKLGAVGLANYFPHGGFSMPGATRVDILRAALEAVQPHPTCAIVIGDTPRDVHAAHAINLPIIAIATGRFSTTDLAHAGADLVLPSLGHVKRFHELFHELL